VSVLRLIYTERNDRATVVVPLTEIVHTHSMRSSSSAGNPPVTAATAATNESLKTVYEEEVLDESNIEQE